MTLTEISNIRIINQKIDETESKTAKEIVYWMGAMQAQSFSMAKWGIGKRLSLSKDEDIELAYNKGEIIRTHVMRPTWHFVAAEDIYWMMELTSEKLLNSLKSRHKDLEISNEQLLKSTRIIEKALSKEISLSREEFATEFNKKNIETSENKLSHYLLYAELNGILCSGPIKNNKLTYSLLQNRVRKTKVLSREESLAELAKRYFTSHGPATLADFAWWSGLSVAEARQALESIKSNFISETIESEKYWFASTISHFNKDKSAVHLLPAFDEFLISYKNRAASISSIYNKKAISENGIFRPIIVVNGQIIGIWKQTSKSNYFYIEFDFFQKPDINTMKLIDKELEMYEYFIGKTLKLNTYK